MIWLTVLYVTTQGLMVREHVMPTFDECLIEMDFALSPAAVEVGVRAAMCREAYAPDSA